MDGGGGLLHTLYGNSVMGHRDKTANHQVEQLVNKSNSRGRKISWQIFMFIRRVVKCIDIGINYNPGPVTEYK